MISEKYVVVAVIIVVFKIKNVFSFVYLPNYFGSATLVLQSV